MLLSPEQHSMPKPSHPPQWVQRPPINRGQKNGSQEGEWRQRGEDRRMNDHTQYVRRNSPPWSFSVAFARTTPPCSASDWVQRIQPSPRRTEVSSGESTTRMTQDAEIVCRRKGPRSRRHTHWIPHLRLRHVETWKQRHFVREVP